MDMALGFATAAFIKTLSFDNRPRESQLASRRCQMHGRKRACGRSRPYKRIVCDVYSKDMTMRGLSLFILFGLIAVGGGLFTATRSSASTVPGPPTQLVDVNATTDRSSYAQSAQRKVQKWKQKLVTFGKKAKAKGNDAGDALGDDLHTAWTKTEAASQRLRTATAEDWDSAKASFEAASQELSDRWQTINHKKK